MTCIHERRECEICGDSYKTNPYKAEINQSRICYDCSIQEQQNERIEHFEGLDVLTIEERIRRIEEWMYDGH